MLGEASEASGELRRKYKARAMLIGKEVPIVDLLIQYVLVG